jgi:glycine cleavage system pyridoxal-binding protein P
MLDPKWEAAEKAAMGQTVDEATKKVAMAHQVTDNNLDLVRTTEETKLQEFLDHHIADGQTAKSKKAKLKHQVV